MRARVRDMIEAIVQVQLDAVWGAARSSRVGRDWAGVPAWGACAHADDEPRADDHSDAPGENPGARRDEDIRYVFLEVSFQKMRIWGRRAHVPVLVTLGVRAGGQRVILDLRLADEEIAARTMTQASLPGQDAVFLLLFGLLRTGHQVKLAALVGHQDMQEMPQAA